MVIRKFDKFFEEYKSKLDGDIDGEDLGKAFAIKDMMMDCPSYVAIKDYINSLYKMKDNIYMAKMFDNIVKAIYLKVEDDREICEIIRLIKGALEELEYFFNKKWKNSKNKNENTRLEIKKYLESLKDGPDIDSSIYGWKEFIRKKLSHAKYEDSFTEEGIFTKYQTQLNLGKLPIREYVFTNNVSEDEIISQFKKLLYSDSLKLTKADLEVQREVKDKSQNVVLNPQDLVEVKYKKWKLKDTLGEFYALSKGNLGDKWISKLDPSVELGRKKKTGYLITDIFSKNPDIFDKYNDIIAKFYTILTTEEKDRGDEILEEIKNSFVGIMFKENRYIKSEDLVIKWGLKGQRKHENRLSITHEPNSNPKVYLYIDDPANPHFRNPKTYND